MVVRRWYEVLKDWFETLLDRNITPVNRKVLAITFAPRIPSRGNLPLFEVMEGWQKPDTLLQQLSSDMCEASHGYANFTVTENIVLSDFTPMIGGLKYTPELYLAAYNEKQPKIKDKADYADILTRFNVIEKIRTGLVDEIWLMGYPFAGFNESRMGGPGAFFCNGDIIPNTDAAGRRFIVMGFSYERGIGEMLESMAHRAEFILERLFAGKTGNANLYERFKRIDWDYPGQAEVGTVHHGPNASLTPDKDDHQWTEIRMVPSRHRTWTNFPNLSGSAELTNCNAWRDTDMTRGHHMWWFKYFPHVPGQQYGITNNWWKVVIDPEKLWP
jgi:hypothetical protein